MRPTTLLDLLPLRLDADRLELAAHQLRRTLLRTCERRRRHEPQREIDEARAIDRNHSASSH
jgi:hypothetical protein